MQFNFKPGAMALLIPLLAVGCAQLHTVKVGERRMSPTSAQPFDVKVNETGFNVKEGTQIVKAIGGQNTAAHKGADVLEKLYEAISFGPKTGKTVMDDRYADFSGAVARQKCDPSKTVGLTTVRETRSYPVISGEIVKIEGLCK